MKMTIEIPEDVLAELMQLTGHQTKRDAVEFALREAARRAKWRRVWSEGLGMTPDELAADAEAAAAGSAWGGLLVDFDHSSLDEDRSTEAAGWADALAARADGLWARIRWTDSGLAAITGYIDISVCRSTTITSA